MRSTILLFTASLLLAACTSDPPKRRLAFLLSQDTTRAYVLDSAFHNDLLGLPPTDPPYESGLNQLTVLGDVHTPFMSVERTIPLGPQGWLIGFALSPDGDTALILRIDPNEVVVLRGLKSTAPYIQATIPFPKTTVGPRVLPISVTISPDGSWALIGNGVDGGPGGPLKLHVLNGLPEKPVFFGEIDLGPDEEIDCGAVASIRITDDGKRAALIHWWGRTHTPIPDEQSMMLIRGPGPGGAQEIVDQLFMSLDPVIPPPPEYEGKNVGLTSGSFVPLWDSDSAVVPMLGAVDLDVVDARILLIRGLSSGQLEIVRTLGPADGVEISPAFCTRLPDSDRVVISHLFAQKFTVLSGLSDSTFQSVGLETFPGDTPIMGSLAVTPDGQTLVLSTPRGPRDNLPPSHVTNWSYDGQSIAALGPALYGPVHEVPFWRDGGIRTVRPGLNDYVACCEALPKAVRESLTAKVTEAVALAEQGRDEESIETLVAFETDVASLVRDKILAEEDAKIMQTLAELGRERLR
jgi:hypothetical protein